jgi:hypothetical protein
MLGWHHTEGEWQKGQHREGSHQWYEDLRHAEATSTATKLVSNALESGLNGFGKLSDGRVNVELQFIQRLSDNEFVVFCEVANHPECVLRIQVQGWKP